MYLNKPAIVVWRKLLSVENIARGGATRVGVASAPVVPTHSVLAGQQGAHTLIDFIVGGRGRIPMLKWILPRLDTCKDFATIIRYWDCLIIKPLIVIGPKQSKTIYQDRRLWSEVFPPSPDIGWNRPRTAGLQENQRRRGVRNMGVWACASSPSTITFIIW